MRYDNTDNKTLKMIEKNLLENDRVNFHMPHDILTKSSDHFLVYLLIDRRPFVDKKIKNKRQIGMFFRHQRANRTIGTDWWKILT